MKMMRRIRLVLLLLVILTPYAYAAEDPVSDSFREEWEVFVGSIPEEIRPLAEDALHSANTGEVMKESLSVSYFLDKTVQELKDAWPSSVGLLLSLTGLLIFSALFHRVYASVSSVAMKSAGELCSTLCLVLCITPLIQSASRVSEEFLGMLATCSGGISPVICALFVSSGNITTASVTNASLMLVYTLFQNGIRVFLWPIVQLLYVLGIVGNLGGSLRLDGISRFIRQLFTWLLSLAMLFLSALIGVQSTMAVSADSFSMKTAKFALGNFIPLVGNALSDAVGTVAGSLTLIKNTCGVLGIVTVALLLLPVLLHLLLHRMVIGAAQGMAELLGCEREGRLLGDVYATLGYILAVVALSSVLFVFILALIISVRF